jgi:nucleotide-binding universal stress UspA family protein
LRGQHTVTVVYGRIVVGYAGDRAGRDGVLLACQLAKLTGAELTVVFPYHPLFATVTGDVAEAQAHSELKALRGDDPVLARARFRWSNASWPIHALHEIAAEQHVDVIVLGAAPERLERRHVELMERVIHGAPCRVAVAPAGYADRRHTTLLRVGVGFADTIEGRAAICEGCELVARGGGELSIIAASGLSGMLVSYAAMSPALHAAEADMHEEMRASVERVTGEIPQAQGSRVRVIDGEPSRVLLAASGELDLLVLGSRGYGPLRCVLLGSVSSAVARDAACPVLVLPRPAVAAGTVQGPRVALAEG